MSVTDRLARRIRLDFTEAEALLVLDGLDAVEPVVTASRQDPERLQAATVLPARGRLQTVRELCDLARLDWRDLLVAGDLADGGWPERLDQELGPA